MGLFNRDNRPTTEQLTARIAELETRQAEIPGEIERAREELTRALAAGEDAAGYRATVASLEAEAGGLPEAITALQAELRAARADAVQAERDAERKAIEGAYSKLEREYSALQKAVSAFNEAIDTAGNLGATRANAASVELVAGPRDPVAHYAVKGAGVLPDFNEIRRQALHRFDQDTAQRVKSAQVAPKESTVPSAEALYINEHGQRRPISERPPREKAEPVTVELQRQPGDSENGVDPRKAQPSLRR